MVVLGYKSLSLSLSISKVSAGIKAKITYKRAQKQTIETALMSTALSQSSGSRPGYAPDAGLLIVSPVTSLGSFSGN